MRPADCSLRSCCSPAWVLGGLVALGGCLLSVGLPPRLVAAQDATVVGGEVVERHFELHVRPLLVKHCAACHGPDKQEGGLRLDSRLAMLDGGDSGAALVPGDPDGSLLMQAVRYEGLEMPPAGALPEADAERLSAWISAGAWWPEQLLLQPSGAAEITEEDRQWWSFQPLATSAPPPLPRTLTGESSESSLSGWPQTAIDSWALQAMLPHGLWPAPAADRTTLVRRLYLDLIGVPPTAEQLESAIGDQAPDAWERLVDRLLADPRYAEHWARFWLDLVRYSESDGWNRDTYRPDMWRYRDYVVGWLAADGSYADFVRQQLAGDLLATPPEPDDLAAVGFLRLGTYEYNQRDARGHWDDILNETTDVVGDVFLGLGIACARCHDHKFDPIPQRDYFRLRAFFESLQWRDDQVYATAAQRAQYERQLTQWRAETADIQQRIDTLLEPYYRRRWEACVARFPLDIQVCYQTPADQRDAWQAQMAYLIGRQFWEEDGGPLRPMTAEDRALHEQLLSELAEHASLRPAELPGLMTVSDHAGPPAVTRIPDRPQLGPVEPGGLTVLGELGWPAYVRHQVDGFEPWSEAALARLGGGRLGLAEWIGEPSNPLTMRVIVNRLWQQHFGRGLSATPNDFGRTGQPPSHPELLDWLAVRFGESGGSFKQLHRLILRSALWQQSAHHPRGLEQQQLDPQELYLWRAPIRRLRAEQVRDAMLLASGQLQQQVGGASVEAEQPRRSLYLKVQRNTPEPFLRSLDMADGLTSSAERVNTTTATQALLLLNGRFVRGEAERLAERSRRWRLGPEAAAVSLEGAVERLVFELWGRRPVSGELAAMVAFVGESPDRSLAEVDPERWVDLCQVLLTSNAFFYVE
jgi:mono/diheme cytochrome c family protein